MTPHTFGVESHLTSSISTVVTYGCKIVRWFWMLRLLLTHWLSVLHQIMSDLFHTLNHCFFTSFRCVFFCMHHIKYVHCHLPLPRPETEVEISHLMFWGVVVAFTFIHPYCSFSPYCCPYQSNESFWSNPFAAVDSRILPQYPYPALYIYISMTPSIQSWHFTHNLATKIVREW